jgi:non-heme chloroperoxidase
MSEALRHFVADDGEPIHLRVLGHGAPVVLLHGWTQSHAEWTYFQGELARRHRVFAWDARGHGGHRLRTGALPTVQRMARDLRNLLDAYALERAVVVGHSMGALTIWEHVRQHGTRGIGRLCLIDQSPRLLTDEQWPHGIYGDFDPGRARDFLEALHDDFAEAVLRLGAYGRNARAREMYERNARGWQRVREQLRALDPVPLIEIWKSLAEADYRDVLERIDVPALLVFGEQSNFYGPGAARWVRERIPRAVLHVYEGTDHSPHQWQRERFLADLAAFVDG